MEEKAHDHYHDPQGTSYHTCARFVGGVRHGQTRQGKQRYRCREQCCADRTFLLDYSYPGQSPAVKQQIVEMAMNASGIRDTARVLHISTNTVMTE